MIKPTRVWSVWAVQRPVKGCEGPVTTSAVQIQCGTRQSHRIFVVILCPIVQSTVFVWSSNSKITPHDTYQPSAIIVVPT